MVCGVDSGPSEVALSGRGACRGMGSCNGRMVYFQCVDEARGLVVRSWGLVVTLLGGVGVAGARKVGEQGHCGGTKKQAQR